MKREILEQPFDQKYIKQRKGNYGATLDYIETHVVIQRLNDSFDGNWSFEIVEWTQLEDEVVVLGRITADGISKQQFGSSKVTRAKGSDVSISIGDDLKSAASDAIKKCATLLGVALHLYGDLPDSAADSTENKSDMATMSGNRGSDLITLDQMKQIKKLRTNLDWSPEDLQERAERLFATRDITMLNSTMAAALIAYLQNQGNGNGK